MFAASVHVSAYLHHAGSRESLWQQMLLILLLHAVLTVQLADLSSSTLMACKADGST